MLSINKAVSMMKKTVLVKINCELEPQLDRKKMNQFFEKMKLLLKIENNLPEKPDNKQKVNKI